MQNTVPKTKVGWSKQQKLVLRLIVMVGVIGALLWWERSPSPSEPPPARQVPVRQATPAEWQRPIAELGTERLAKQLTWLASQASFGPGYQGPRSAAVAAEGRLVWWHGPAGEALSYLPASGETEMDGIRLVNAIHRGRVTLYNRHGDPSLILRLGELPAGLPLPDGWTVLTPPPLPASEPAPPQP